MSVCIDPRPVVPAVATPGGQEGARTVRMADGVDAVAVLADDLPQRRPEDRGDDVAEAVAAAHGDAERSADRAARAVGGDEVAGADGAHVAARDVAQHDLDALRLVADLHRLGVEVNAARAEGAQVLEQDGLEMILGHAGWCGRAEQGGLRARRDAGGPHRPLAHAPPGCPTASRATRRRRPPRGRPPRRPMSGSAPSSAGSPRLRAEATTARPGARRASSPRRGAPGRWRPPDRPGRRPRRRPERLRCAWSSPHFVGHHVFHKTSCRANIV